MDLSVIIPLYNHGKYVEQSIRSILKNINCEIEVIVVDDGSTDCSNMVVKELQKEFSAIRIIQNEKNMGCAYSINVGLDIAKGKYVGINSSDDFVDEGYYDKMLEVALKEDADIVCANIATFNPNTQKIMFCKIEENNIANEYMCEYTNEPVQVSDIALLGHWTASSASTKIIKKEYYDKYKFCGTKANDIPCIYPIMAASNKIFYYPKLYKYYREVDKSLSRSDDVESYNSVIQSIIKAFLLLDDIGGKDLEKELLFFNNCLNYFFYVLNKIVNMEIRLECMEEFVRRLIEYDEEIFYKMKKSNFFAKYINNNHITIENYNMIAEERIADFIINNKQ